MLEPEPFVDIHCHLLPGLDDGPTEAGQSLAMAQMAAADGISTIVVTPHQLGNYRQICGRTIRDRTAQLQDLLHQQGLQLEVLPGADVRIEPELIAKIAGGEVLTLADRGRHVLLELPHETYFPLERFLRNLDRAGLVGILSHPERNLAIAARPSIVRPLVDAGCLMQVTAGSLVGGFGPEARKVSQWLISEGLVHFVATDAHGPQSRRPLLRRSYERIVKLVGSEGAERLCCRNPAAVAAGREVAAGSSRPRISIFAGWLGRQKAG